MINKAMLLNALSEGLMELQLSIPQTIQLQLIDYLELLVKWNAVHNLTAVRDPLEMVKRHVLDSLVLLPFLDDFCKSRSTGKANILDVGTGAGLPGIPLALARPEQKFVLLDSNQKKIAFVQHMILSLKLANASVVCARIEKYHPDARFDWVVSRAFTSLSEFVALSDHVCKDDSQWVAMKGLMEPAEMKALSSNYLIEKIEPVTVPGLTAKHTLVFIKRTKHGGRGVK